MKRAPCGRHSRADTAEPLWGFLDRTLRLLCGRPSICVARVGCSVCLWSAGEEQRQEGWIGKKGDVGISKPGMQRVPLNGELARFAQTHGGGIHAQP